MKFLGKEGFKRVHVLRGESDVDTSTIVYERLLNDLRHETGPFDVIGDVHGCRAELEELLAELGYDIRRDDEGRAIDAIPPANAGPSSSATSWTAGRTHRRAAPGHGHDRDRARVQSSAVTTSRSWCGRCAARTSRSRHGLAESLAQLAAEDEDFRRKAESSATAWSAHYVLDDGKLVVAHAGLPERYHGRASARVRSFALYGDTTGETDDYGLPVRYPWANEYRGTAMVLYGHTPTPEVEWINNTMCLDTGVVFGGKLTALRYPEKEIVSVQAHEVWYEPTRPLVAPTGGREPDVLALTDVTGAPDRDVDDGRRDDRRSSRRARWR